ncbi:MAG: hypothetical protein ABI921_07910 [Panacibacter sp.]
MNNQRRTLWAFTAIIAAIAVYCYNPFALYFQNDDFIHIPLSAQGVLLQHNTFRPICDLSIMLDYSLWGKNAYGYHFTNLILHIICTVFVFLLACGIQKKYRPVSDGSYAFITALLFFLYPMHSEAVLWILGRSAILGCMFFLLSIVFFLKRDKQIFFFLSIFSALAAWFSYESSWILPVILFCISFIDTRIKHANLKKETQFIFAVVLCFTAYIITRNYFIHEVIGQYEAAGFLHFNIESLTTNFLKLMLRSWLPPFEDSIWLIVLFILIFGLLTAFYFQLKEKSSKSFLFVLMALWLVALIPYASLGIDTKGTEGERFIYLPSVFNCQIVSFCIHHFSSKRYFQNIALSVLAIFYLGILYINAGNYRLAGNIVKATITEVGKLLPNQTLYVQSLPQSQNGALIFRDGFKEAVDWMLNTQPAHSIVICSAMPENMHIQNLYKVQYTDSVILNQCNGAKPGKDSVVAIFNYTDSVLYISK